MKNFLLILFILFSPSILLAAQPEILDAIDAMTDYKIFAYCTVIVLLIIEVIIVRNGLRKRQMLGKHLKGYFTSSVLIIPFVNLAINWGIYFLCSLLSWFDVDRIRFWLSPESSIAIRKKLPEVLSLGLGPFYVAHSIDILLFSTILFLIIMLMLRKIKDN